MGRKLPVTLQWSFHYQGEELCTFYTSSQSKFIFLLFEFSIGVTYQTSVIENCSEADWDEVCRQLTLSFQAQ